MKTPREILLQKHAAANEQLDKIRAGVVSDLEGRSSAARQMRRVGPTFWPGWAELVWSMRGHVAALAGAWVLIALLTVQSAGDQPVVATTHSHAAEVELLLVARENRLHMRELLGTTDPGSTHTAAPAPRPRSQSDPGAMWQLVTTSGNC